MVTNNIRMVKIALIIFAAQLFAEIFLSEQIPEGMCGHPHQCKGGETGHCMRNERHTEFKHLCSNCGKEFR